MAGPRGTTFRNSYETAASKIINEFRDAGGRLRWFFRQEEQFLKNSPANRRKVRELMKKLEGRVSEHINDSFVAEDMAKLCFFAGMRLAEEATKERQKKAKKK